MNRYALALLLMFGFVFSAWADTKQETKPGTTAMIGAVSVSATVEGIDKATRHVTLKSDDGRTMTLKVGEYAQNFNQVKIGDRVTFNYMEGVAMDVKKGEGPLEPEVEISAERAPLGARPAGAIAATITMRALVENIDYNTRKVTLKGPEGNTVTLKVDDRVKRLNEVKKGDQVVVRYAEAMGVSVEPAKG